MLTLGEAPWGSSALCAATRAPAVSGQLGGAALRACQLVLARGRSVPES